VRIASSNHLTTGVALGIVAGIGIAVGIASSLVDRAPKDALVVEVSLPADLGLELQPSSASIIHEPPPPPEGPFYASLFVAGTTWTLPCRFGDGQPTSMQRCRVESVEVTPQTATARIGCWYVHEGTIPDPAVNTYVMTPTGLYKADHAPSTRGTPLFTPHPVPKSLPKDWGYEEPRGPTWANAIVRHHGAWCTVDEFVSEDYSAGYTECISRHGIVGLSNRRMGGMTERCGDVPRDKHGP
jgi:hypothetical protein